MTPQTKLSPKLPQEFLTQIASQFPKDFMTQDAAELENFGRDWTRVFAPNPSAVVFPRSTEEVAAFLKLCSQHKVAVVPSGGRTGLAAGAVATQGEVVLSLTRMNAMGKVDTLAQTVEVQAGAVTEAVHQHCAPHGLTWPVDFASKGSSHVGGNISTNAGGVKVIRYGLTRNWVLGLKAVTMSGQILNFNGALEKNNTGVDLRQLLIGSEGTLAVVTEATLKLTRLHGDLDVFFFALDHIPAVLKLFHEVRRSPFQIMAFEFLTQNCLEIVCKYRGIKPPLEINSKPGSETAYVLLEVERPLLPDAQESLDKWLEGLFEKGLVTDGTLAQSPKEARQLWSIREGITESMVNRGFVYKNDISLPIARLQEFIEKMNEFFRSRHEGLEIFLFGHIGDGNLHVNTMKPDSMEKEEFLKLCHHADEGLFELVKKYQGSVSAEHGIGLLKKSALHFSRTPEEIELMRGIKKVFDPQNLLNPGKIFD